MLILLAHVKVFAGALTVPLIMLYFMFSYLFM